jgi:hypothetical protein
MSGAFPGLDGLAPDLAEELRAQVKSELAPGERVLWVGRPGGSRAMTGTGCLIAAGVLAGVMLAACLLAIAAYFGAWGRPANDGTLALGLVFGVLAALVAMGIVGSYHSDRRARRAEARNVYAITDRRALLWINDEDTPSVAIRSIERGRIGDLHRVEREGGRGDVIIRLVSLTRDRSYFDQALKLLDVEDARAVEELIRRTLVAGTHPDTSRDESFA